MVKRKKKDTMQPSDLGKKSHDTGKIDAYDWIMKRLDDPDEDAYYNEKSIPSLERKQPQGDEEYEEEEEEDLPAQHDPLRSAIRIDMSDLKGKSADMESRAATMRDKYGVLVLGARNDKIYMAVPIWKQ